MITVLLVICEKHHMNVVIELNPCAVKLLVPWAEVTRLERVSVGLLTDVIRVHTRQKQRDFSMFLNVDDVMKVMCQLADIALRRLLDSGGLMLDQSLQDPTNITKRSTSFHYSMQTTVNVSFIQSGAFRNKINKH